MGPGPAGDEDGTGPLSSQELSPPRAAGAEQADGGCAFPSGLRDPAAAKGRMKKKQQHGGGDCPATRPPAAAGGGPGQSGGWKRRRPLSLLPFPSLRDYGFCMAALLLFCLGSLFYQLNGGPPHFLLDLRHYLGKGGCGWRGLVAAPPRPPWRLSWSLPPAGARGAAAGPPGCPGLGAAGGQGCPGGVGRRDAGR